MNGNIDSLNPHTDAISLYFHVPFCTHKCGYCHFYVIPNKEPHKKLYMESLEKEWLLRAPELKNKKIISIYFGGGTPSLLGAEYLHKILHWVQRDVDFDKLQTEITLEANPENVTSASMHEYAQAGVNRVSLGIQTLNDSLLKTLERTHNGEKAIQAVYDTRDAGIFNITVDLMYDLPRQTLPIWQDTLSKIHELPIQHLSLYNLTIEPHTTFFKHQDQLKKQLPDPEMSLKMYEMAQEMLNNDQLNQYEISAFAKVGYQSKHNTGYWKARPFLGLGPSAYSYWEGKRFRNIANLNRYANLLKDGTFPVDFEEKLDPLASLRELFAIRIRLMEGVNLEDFTTHYGKLDQETWDNLKKLEQQGYLERDSQTIRLTKHGILFYDTVAVELI